MYKFLVIISLLIFISCNNQIDEKDIGSSEKIALPIIESFNISVDIKNDTNEYCYLYLFGQEKQIVLDSIKYTSSEFIFKREFENECSLLSVGSSPEKSIIFIAKHGEYDISISADYNNLPFNYNIEGSNSSKLIKQYNTKRNEFYNKVNEIQNELTSLRKTNLIKKEELISKAQKLKSIFDEYKFQFIDLNSDSPALLLALYDISDYVAEIDKLRVVEKAIRKYFANTIFHKEVSMRIEQAIKQKQAVKQQEQMLKQQEMELSSAGISVGKQAPELNFPDINGENIALSSLKGKVVLLDFWASWCGPCRKENPFVVGLYNKYKDKGFTIYSFSLDKDKTKWIQAIQQDNLSWKNHVSDLMAWNSLGAAKYKIRSIPQTFLIDRQGNISAIGLRGEKLERKLIEIM